MDDDFTIFFRAFKDVETTARAIADVVGGVSIERGPRPAPPEVFVVEFTGRFAILNEVGPLVTESAVSYHYSDSINLKDWPIALMFAHDIDTGALRNAVAELARLLSSKLDLRLLAFGEEGSRELDYETM